MALRSFVPICNDKLKIKRVSQEDKKVVATVCQFLLPRDEKINLLLVF